MQATRKGKKKSETPVKIKYDMHSALYANQFVVNQSAEEIFVDFSSGAIPDPSTGQTMIPIHTRLAFSYQGAQRLASLLQQAVERHNQRASSEPEPIAKGKAAS